LVAATVGGSSWAFAHKAVPALVAFAQQSPRSQHYDAGGNNGYRNS
jgi:hypothetical protein